MSKFIRLRCPKCDRCLTVERAPYDYPEAKRMDIICWECDDGDFHEAMYYDAKGKHITRDPDEVITEPQTTVGAGEP